MTWALTGQPNGNTPLVTVERELADGEELMLIPVDVASVHYKRAKRLELLADFWECLEKRECPQCDGEGTIWEGDETASCEDCEGTGIHLPAAVLEWAGESDE